MMFYMVALAFFFSVSIAMDGNNRHSPTSTSTELTSATPSSQPSSSQPSDKESEIRRPGKQWTQERRERFNKTIATRTLTAEMRDNYAKARRGTHHSPGTRMWMSIVSKGHGALPPKDGSTQQQEQQQQARRNDYPKNRARPDPKLMTPERRMRISVAQKQRWEKVRALKDAQGQHGEGSSGGGGDGGDEQREQQY